MTSLQAAAYSAQVLAALAGILLARRHAPHRPAAVALVLLAASNVVMAYAAPRANPAPAPTLAPAAPSKDHGMDAPAPAGAPAAPQGLDALLAEMVKLGAEEESLPELIYVRHRDGRVRYYRPEAWPPDGGDTDGARVVRRKLGDGTWEDYDPPAHIVKMAGPPGPDGLVTMPGGRRVRYVFTDAGAP